VWEALQTIALTLIIFLALRAAVQNFRVEGYSMEPNFHDGQYLIIDKVSYYFSAPARGDIVVFRFVPSQRDFIKRVVALPGETVEVRDGRVLVNGQPLAEDYPLHPAVYSWGPATVGPDEYFVLGDNRGNSSDSHSWGMLPKSEIIGKAWVSYWPPSTWGIVQTPSSAAAP